MTIPILRDKARAINVSNESSEIVRMFNKAFDDVTDVAQDFWPKEMRSAMAPMNDPI